MSIFKRTPEPAFEELVVEPHDALDYVEPEDGLQDELGTFGFPTGLSPRNGAEAVVYAKRMSARRTYVGVGMCLKTVRGYYGINSKYPDAESGYNHTKYRHRVDINDIPAGVVIWWTNGRHGHVAISIGNGLCLSTDWKERGKIDVARIADIGPRWGQTFQGGFTEDINDVRYWKPAPKPTVSLKNLKFGKANTDVLEVKQHLKNRGFFKGSLIKFYGPGLKSSYRRWQEHLGYHGAAADGIPGKTSLEKLGFRVVP